MLFAGLDMSLAASSALRRIPLRTTETFHMADRIFQPLSVRDTGACRPLQVVSTVLSELARSTDPAVVFASLVTAYSAAASVFCAVELITGNSRSLIKGSAAPGGEASHSADSAHGAEDEQLFAFSRRLMSGDGQPLIDGDWVAVPIGAAAPSAAGRLPAAGTVGAFVCKAPDPSASEDHAEIARVLVAAATEAISREQRAVKAEQDVENLQIALRSNRDIGTAMGILMSVQLITQDEAFDVLRRASQHGHRKLRDVAVDVIFTGALEMLPPRQAPGGTAVPRPRSASY